MPQRVFMSCLAATWLMASAAPGFTSELASADGPVVLTVTGNIEHTNRSPFEEFSDPFINYHERPFEKAAEFDFAMLEQLGMHEIEVTYEGWPQSVNLAGPRLIDLLDAVGAEPEAISVVALDGFSVDMTSDDLTREDWIVAIKQDGAYMGVGQRGPIWVVFDPGEDKMITAEEEGTWPWAAFFIEIQ